MRLSTLLAGPLALLALGHAAPNKLEASHSLEPRKAPGWAHISIPDISHYQCYRNCLYMAAEKKWDIEKFTRKQFCKTKHGKNKIRKKWHKHVGPCLVRSECDTKRVMKDTNHFSEKFCGGWHDDLPSRQHEHYSDSEVAEYLSEHEHEPENDRELRYKTKKHHKGKHEHEGEEEESGDEFWMGDEDGDEDE